MKPAIRIILSTLALFTLASSSQAQSPDKQLQQAPANPEIRMLYDVSDANNHHRLVLADEKGVEVKSLDGFGMYTQWSPDGSRILFVGDDTDWPETPFITGLDLKPWPLIRGYLDLHSPTWSADGKSIIDVTRGVESIGVDSKKWLTLCSDKGEISIMGAFPSPDGKRLAVIGYMASSDITAHNEDVFVMESDCSKPVRLTTDKPSPSDIRWSRDGKRLAFVMQSKNYDHSTIVVIDADGQNRLEFREGWHDAVSWTDDGRLLTTWSNGTAPDRTDFLGIIDPATGLATVLRKGVNLRIGFADWRPRKMPKETGATNPTADRCNDMLNSGNMELAVPVCKEEAEHGNVAAQLNLASMYYDGTGVAKDYKEVAKWYGKAAELGVAMAQNNLGAMYGKGQGVAQDYEQAVKWYRKAAEQGMAMAQGNLGDRYYNGQGVTQDYEEAAKWYRKAAEQGYDSSQFNLGAMYFDGRGVKQDHVQAFHWYEMAAKQGMAAAEYNVAVMYLNGDGVQQDTAGFSYWLRKAVDQGYEPAVKLREERDKE
jgi:Sel1 repeat/WD40-like Beta Propeller Repeat